MTNIHSSSVVDPKANLGSGVEVGPFCVIGPDVTLGDGCKLHSHVVIEGQTTLGANCEIFPFASLKGLNVIGIKRRGFDREQLRNLREAYDNLFAEEGTLVERVEAVEKAFPDDEYVTSILEFIRADSSRSLSVPKQDTA